MQFGALLPQSTIVAVGAIFQEAAYDASEYADYIKCWKTNVTTALCWLPSLVHSALSNPDQY